MKVIKIVERVISEKFGNQEERIKALEKELKATKEEREKQDEDEVSPYQLKAEIEVLRDIPLKRMDERLKAIEQAGEKEEREIEKRGRNEFEKKRMVERLTKAIAVGLRKANIIGTGINGG